MKRTQLLVLAVLALGLQGVAQATPFPSDAEASHSVAAPDTYADIQARSGTWAVNERSSQSAFPSDAEASHSLAARGSYAEKHANDVVQAMRAEEVVAFNGSNIDD